MSCRYAEWREAAAPALSRVLIFPEKIQRIVKQASEEANYPLNYIAAALFFAASVAVGNFRTLMAGTIKVKAILFMALIGTPGSGKTHPINFAVAPFLRLDKSSIQKYQNSLEEWRKTPAESRGKKPKAKQFRVQDITMEAITKILGETRRGIFVFVDELKGWVSSFNKYRNGGGDLEQWLSLYNGVPITVNRKGEDDITFVADPFVGVIGGMQPGILPRLFGGSNMDNGFFYRLLFVNNNDDGKPLLWRKADIPSGCDEEWRKFINSILRPTGYFDEKEIETDYTFSDDAWDYLVDWQNGIEERNAEDEPESVIAIFRKIQDYCLRFCLIIHVMREAAEEIPRSKTIDEDTALRATILAEYFFLTAKETYNLVQQGGFNHGKFFDLINCLNSTFTADQAVAVGGRIGISRNTVFRYLRQEADGPFLKKTGHGKYAKIE